jgi:hypothetical protein
VLKLFHILLLLSLLLLPIANLLAISEFTFKHRAILSSDTYFLAIPVPLPSLPEEPASLLLCLVPDPRLQSLRPRPSWAL